MAFLLLTDYASQIDEDDLDTLTNASDAIRLGAEEAAMEEAASYLRGRYDMTAAYALTDAQRNKQLVMFLVDLAIWHMLPRIAFRAASEIREIRYKAAVAWLTKVEARKSNPDLPSYPLTFDGSKKPAQVRWGSQPARSHNY